MGALMAEETNNSVIAKWREFENDYQMVYSAVQAFVTEASLIGANMIIDIPTRLEYMKMIRAEADDMLAFARKNGPTQSGRDHCRVSLKDVEPAAGPIATGPPLSPPRC